MQLTGQQTRHVLCLVFLSIFFAIVVSASSSSVLDISPSSSSTFIWQGFHHQWLRKFLGEFRTPHRMGSWANYIEDAVYSSNSASAIANFTFTPGVNGDYAYPALYFTLISSAKEDIQFSSAIYSTQFEDSATETEYPTASTTIKETLEFPTSDFNSAVLSGYRIDMECNPDLQPQGQECNSNGIWPTYFNLHITGCSQTNSTTLSCDILFQLERACNPGCNAPFSKPFNYVMSYNLFLYFTLLNNGTDFVVAPGPTIAESSITIEGPVDGTVILQGEPGLYPIATSAISGFSFNLTGYKDIKEMGRYMESLSFLVSDVLYDEEKGQLAVDYRMGYDTPLTTHPSDITYTMQPVLLQMSGAVVHYPSESPVNGTVCISDNFFKCQHNIDHLNLTETTNDAVNFNVNF